MAHGIADEVVQHAFPFSDGQVGYEKKISEGLRPRKSSYLVEKARGHDSMVQNLELHCCFHAAAGHQTLIVFKTRGSPAHSCPMGVPVTVARQNPLLSRTLKYV